MKIEAIGQGSIGMPARPEITEQVERDRQITAELPDTPELQKKVNSEELFDKIKTITQDGQYSIQFEMNRDVNSLVIKLVNRDSGELVRQIPSEELIRSSKALHDLRGLMLDTEQ